MISFLLALLASLTQSAVVAPQKKCPDYKSLMDKSVDNFNPASYQGEWYTIAHNEPTEPPFLTCDRMTWLFDDLKISLFISPSLVNI